MGIFDFMGKQTTLPPPDPRLVEAVRLIDVQAAAIARLEKEIEIRNGIIERNKYMWKLNEAETEKMLGQIEAAERVIEEYKKQEERLIKEIYRLRRELKKRTDQYNELVDLAREHDII